MLSHSFKRFGICKDADFRFEATSTELVLDGTITTHTFDNASRLTGLAQDLPGTLNDQTLGFSFTNASQISQRIPSESKNRDSIDLSAATPCTASSSSPSASSVRSFSFRLSSRSQTRHAFSRETLCVPAGSGRVRPPSL